MGAVDYLKKNPLPGPMYNNYGFGGYLVWSRGPEQKVFIDGRGDVYERGGVLAGLFAHLLAATRRARGSGTIWRALLPSETR